jgi:regulatory protein
VATITAIERQKRRRRADVCLDGEPAFSLGLDLIAERGLMAGMTLSPAQRRDLEAEDGRRGAVQAALRLLAMNPRSERELSLGLRKRGFRHDAVEAGVTRMKELGYVDDAAFARSWVEARQSAAPRSRRFVLFELGRKGVEREAAVAAVEGLSDEAAAYEAAQRRLRALRGLDHATFQRRLGAFLAGRGFGYGVARAVIERCWDELAEGE